MNFSLKPHLLLARWIPGFIVALATTLPINAWDARVLTDGAALFLMAVAAFVIGQLIDSFRDCVVEKLLDKPPGKAIHWDFFLHSMDQRFPSLESHCVYYVFNANTVLAAVFGSVVMGASWALEGARHGNPAVALWILATMMPVGIGILSWKAIKLRDEIAYLTRGFIPGLPHHGVYARLKPSRVAPGGVGAFAIQSIPKGAPVFLGDDCRMSWVHRDLINGLNGSLWQLYDDFGIVKNKGELWGCPWNFNATTVAWYVNHSPSPNMFCKDYDFFAARDIEPGEELTVDYHTFNDFDQVPDYMRAGAVGTV